MEVKYHVTDEGNFVTIHIHEANQPLMWLQVPDANLAKDICTVANAAIAVGKEEFLDQLSGFFIELHREYIGAYGP